MVLNHRLYYQLLKHDLLISFEPLLPSQAHHFIILEVQSTSVPAGECYVSAGFSLPLAAVVLAQCIAPFYHEHLVGVVLS